MEESSAAGFPSRTHVVSATAVSPDEAEYDSFMRKSLRSPVCAWSRSRLRHLLHCPQSSSQHDNAVTLVGDCHFSPAFGRIPTHSLSYLVPLVASCHSARRWRHFLLFH